MAFEAEEVLQNLLVQAPDLLAGVTEGGTSPRRWMLVKREKGVPDAEDGADRWSLDHLFLDQDAVPTLVEVKRASDERSRRKVVAQMLNYAANAIRFWSISSIREAFAQTAESEGQDPDQRLKTLIGDADPEEFWKRVETNLRDGRIRMIFVADEIAPELQRIIEFLNEQMRSATMAAVEIRHFRADGTRLLVPRVVGQTARAQAAKSAGASTTLPPISESEWLQKLAERSPEFPKIAQDLIARFRTLPLETGLASKQAALYIRVINRGTWRYPFSIWSNGSLSVNFMWLLSSEPFADESARREVLNRLNAVPGLKLTNQNIAGLPMISLSQFKDGTIMTGFKDVARWVVERLHAG